MVEQVESGLIYSASSPSGIWYLDDTTPKGFREDIASFRITSFGDFYLPTE